MTATPLLTFSKGGVEGRFELFLLVRYTKQSLKRWLSAGSVHIKYELQQPSIVGVGVGVREEPFPGSSKE